MAQSSFEPRRLLSTRNGRLRSPSYRRHKRSIVISDNPLFVSFDRTGNASAIASNQSGQIRYPADGFYPTAWQTRTDTIDGIAPP